MNIIFDKRMLFVNGGQCNTQIGLQAPTLDILCRVNPFDYANIIVYHSDNKEKILFIEDKILGTGAYGIVSIGRLYIAGISNMMNVAVKRITKKVTDVEQKQLDSEICLLNEFRNGCSPDNEIICFYDNFILRNENYIIMELANGETVSMYIKNNFDKPNYFINTLKIFKKIIEGCKLLHEKNIAHRDIKPQNIIVYKKDSDFLIKIIDFGISCVECIKEECHIGQTCNKCDPESTPMFAGTIYYAAPELNFAYPCDNNPNNFYQNADIYSLGATFYNMLTNIIPYSDLNILQIGFKLLFSENGNGDLFENYQNKSVDKNALCLDLLKSMMALPVVNGNTCKDNDRISLTNIESVLNNIITQISPSMQTGGSSIYQLYLNHKFKF